MVNGIKSRWLPWLFTVLLAGALGLQIVTCSKDSTTGPRLLEEEEEKEEEKNGNRDKAGG